MIISQLLIIILFTVGITVAVCYTAYTKDKLVYIVASITTFIYSGVGIAYETVEFKYFLCYVLFLSGLLCTLKCLFSQKIVLSKKLTCKQYDFNCDSRIITFMSVLFFVTLSLYLVYPNFHPWILFKPTAPISINIYAQRAAVKGDSLLKLADTINMMCLPFFCLYLRRLVNYRKKVKMIFLIVLWAYITYIQYSYIGRYQILVFFVFIFCSCAFVYPEGIILKKKFLLILLGIVIGLIPFFVAYTSIRHGISVSFESLKTAIPLLIDEECYYPKYYSVCENMAGEGDCVAFLAWLIFLPIPSFLFIFGTKPTMIVAHQFTYAVSGQVFGNAYYSSSLPSVVGEGVIIWGFFGVVIHGIIIGIIMAFFFNFMKEHKSLDILYFYMLIQLAVLGRGGAQSYMGTLINGTIFIMLWLLFVSRCKFGNISFKNNLTPTE